MGPTACSHPQPQQHSEPLQPHPGGLQGGHSARPRVWVERQQKKQLSMGVSLLGGTRAGGPRRAATDTGGGQRVGQSRRDVVGPVGQVGAQTPAAQRDTQLGAAGRDGCGIKQGPCSSNTAETTPSHCQNTATPPPQFKKEKKRCSNPHTPPVPHSSQHGHGQRGTQAGQDGGDDDRGAAATCGCGVDGAQAASWKGTG